MSVAIRSYFSVQVALDSASSNPFKVNPFKFPCPFDMSFWVHPYFVTQKINAGAFVTDFLYWGKYYVFEQFGGHGLFI